MKALLKGVIAGGLGALNGKIGNLLDDEIVQRITWGLVGGMIFEVHNYIGGLIVDAFFPGTNKQESLKINMLKFSAFLKVEDLILKVPVNLFLLETYQEHLGTYSKKQFFNMYHKILLHNKSTD